MTVEGLQSIPGIGEKTAQRFISHFGNEQAALDAILNADIAGISGIEGIGRRYAVSLVQDMRARAEGVEQEAFLKNREAVAVYEKLMGILQSFASTAYARDKLNLYIPYPAARSDLIMKNREQVSKFLELCDKIDDEERIGGLLSGIRPLSGNVRISKVHDRALIVQDHNILSSLKKRFGSSVPVHLAENPKEFDDVASGYSHVTAVGEDFLDFCFSGDVEPEFISSLEDLDEWLILPERQIACFTVNREIILQGIEIVQLLEKSGVCLMDNIPDLARLQALLSGIDPEGNLSPGTDAGVDRLLNMLEGLDSLLEAELARANEQMDSLLGNSKLTLSGKDMVGMIKGELSPEDLLSKEMRDSYLGITGSVKGAIAHAFSMDSAESLLLDGIFPDEVMYPLEINSSALSYLKNHIKNRYSQKQLEYKRSFAKELAEFRPVVTDLVSRLLEFDVGFAIARFSKAFDMHMPVINENNGMSFKGAKNLFLADRGIEVDPVEYSVGCTSLDPDGRHSPVVLLSGVNSGGKTSLLELIAQCAILSQIGFPVPAAYMETGLVEGIHYYGKSRGTLDAGAFETTLKTFSSLDNNSSKLVLVDELESITEPGASAKIIAGIIEMLLENTDNLAVFVSHLSESILGNTDAPLRVDGIEAGGLGPDMQLLVDRNPQYNHIAKSTPELIVERLFRTGDRNEFYGRLRDKFR
jgi:dsDNA-specific endonuclease/ATPase MutS2